MYKIRLWFSRNGGKYITILILMIIVYACIKILNNSYKIKKENSIYLHEFNDVTDWDIEIDEPEVFDDDNDDGLVEDQLEENFNLQGN